MPTINLLDKSDKNSPQSISPGDRVRYIGKNPSIRQVAWSRDWFTVVAVAGEMVTFRHRDWFVSKECPATDLAKISEKL